jgi:hypothetical protein
MDAHVQCTVLAEILAARGCTRVQCTVLAEIPAARGPSLSGLPPVSY